MKTYLCECRSHGIPCGDDSWPATAVPNLRGDCATVTGVPMDHWCLSLPLFLFKFYSLFLNYFAIRAGVTADRESKLKKNCTQIRVNPNYIRKFESSCLFVDCNTKMSAISLQNIMQVRGIVSNDEKDGTHRRERRQRKFHLLRFLSTHFFLSIHIKSPPEEKNTAHWMYLSILKRWMWRHFSMLNSVYAQNCTFGYFQLHVWSQKKNHQNLVKLKWNTVRNGTRILRSENFQHLEQLQ